MQKVWFRKQTGWWYATVRKEGARHQVPLVKAPNDRAGKRLAEEQLVRELAHKEHFEDSADKAPAWATVGHVVTAFLKHSEDEHEAATARWYLPES